MFQEASYVLVSEIRWKELSIVMSLGVAGGSGELAGLGLTGILKVPPGASRLDPESQSVLDNPLLSCAYAASTQLDWK